MRFLFSLLVLFLFSAPAALASSLVHLASGHPSGWQQLTSVSDSHEVRIALPIKLRNVDMINTLLVSVSDPRSPHYSKYLSFDDATKLTENPQSTRAVVDYLRRIGATNIVPTRSGDYVKATVTASAASKFFQADVYHFAHKVHRNVRVQRALSYTVPAELSAHIDFIGYLAHFPTMFAKKLLKPLSSSSINQPGNTFPSLITKVYNIDSTTVTNAGATQSCFESGQWISNADLNSFQRQYGLLQQNLTAIVGPNYPDRCAADLNNCIESTLDFEYIMAVAQGASTSYIAVDETDQQPFLDFALHLSNDPRAPLVNSISYGEVEQQADPSVVTRFNTEVQKLGVRGITVVVASGDDGVANFVARNDLSKCAFNPSYPASSPFVTAVGATQGPEVGQPETAERSDAQGTITTGGGFSTVFPSPSYQSGAVQQFLNSSTALPPSGLFNAKGRGYPDVAVLGINYETVDAGQNVAGSGTSASAPVFAAMLTLINSARLDAGKAPVGFVNPALYHLAATSPAIFHDVTSGENNCVAGDGSQCCQYGFTAQKGWDPVTGLGSVDFTALKKAFLALP